MTRTFWLFSAAILWAISAGPALCDTAGMRGGLFELQGGEALYSNICQGCHMADAKGAVGAGVYPALAANPHLASAAYVARMVLNGRKAMPGFGDNLSDQQVADTVNYLRSHFGNRYSDRLQAADVKSLRQP
jgi:mono/diheme cytochrome c family protein